MRKYCEACDREIETKIELKKEDYVVFGESIEIEAKVLVCTECGEEFFNEELDNNTLLEIYDEYRRRCNLSPETDISIYAKSIT